MHAWHVHAHKMSPPLISPTNFQLLSCESPSNHPLQISIQGSAHLALIPDDGPKFATTEIVLGAVQMDGGRRARKQGEICSQGLQHREMQWRDQPVRSRGSGEISRSDRDAVERSAGLSLPTWHPKCARCPSIESPQYPVCGNSTPSRAKTPARGR